MMPNEFFDALDAYEVHRVSLRVPCEPRLKAELYRQQDGQCAESSCGEGKSIHDLVCDYRVPPDLGGTDHHDNIQLLCRECAAFKHGDETTEVGEQSEVASLDIKARRNRRWTARAFASALRPLVVLGLTGVALSLAILMVGTRCL